MNNIQDSLLKSRSTNSLVVNTLTNGCFLKCKSLDQITALRNIASARYGESLESGKDVIACFKNFIYSEVSKKDILSSISFLLNSNSYSESFDLNKHSCLCSSNSSFINSGAQNSNLKEEKINEFEENGFINEKNILLSNITFIFVPYFNDSDLNNSCFSFGESCNSSLLKDSFFAFLPNSTDHLINSCSSLEFNFFNNISANFSRSINLSLINSDQFTQANSDISDFNFSSIASVIDATYIPPLDFNSFNFSSSLTLSVMALRATSATFTSGNVFLNLDNTLSGIDNVILGILISPNYQNIGNYLYKSKDMDIYKPFDFNLTSVKEVYESFNNGKLSGNNIYFTNAGNYVKANITNFGLIDVSNNCNIVIYNNSILGGN